MIAEFLATIGQVIWIACYIPQIYTTLKTKSVEGINIITWLFFLMGYLTILPLLIVKGVHPLIEGYIVTIVLVLVELFLIWKYKKND